MEDPGMSPNDERSPQNSAHKESSKDEKATEFVYESENQEVPQLIKWTMTKLVVRGSTVRAIGLGAFEECIALKEIDMSEAPGLETIGVSAFSYCCSLTAFKCPSNVKTIGILAFGGCENLREVDLSEATALETIGMSAFSNCSGLTSFKWSLNVKLIGEDAFMQCCSLKEVDLRRATALETIGAGALSYCPSLTAFKCSSNVKTIGNNAFEWCESLERVDLSEATALETIGEEAFCTCTSLASFKCSPNVKRIRKRAFVQCCSLKEVDLSEAIALESIEEDAFGKCTSLVTFKCSSNVKILGTSPFAHCSILLEIDLSEDALVENIGMECWGKNAEELENTQTEVEKEVGREKAEKMNADSGVKTKQVTLPNFASEGNANDIMEGWLSKQSRKHPYRWQDRYFAVGHDGSVIYYRGGKDKHVPSLGIRAYCNVDWDKIGDGKLKLSSRDNHVVPTLVVRKSKVKDCALFDRLSNGNSLGSIN